MSEDSVESKSPRDRDDGRGAGDGDARPDEAVTRVLDAVGRGEAGASQELLPLVYHELRKLAQARMARTPPGNTLQPTALVHEAFLRLVGKDDPNWNGRGHFFGAAAEAMRQILVEQARRKARLKHGGGRVREGTASDLPDIESPMENMVALDDALTRLEAEDAHLAQIVKLRYFAGLTREETAAAVGSSVRTLDRDWRYLVARLHQLMGEGETSKRPNG